MEEIILTYEDIQLFACNDGYHIDVAGDIAAYRKYFDDALELFAHYARYETEHTNPQ
jgi:hypothetical protein